MTDPYTPLPEHRFTFGPRTVGNSDFHFGSEAIRDAYGHEHLDQLVTERLLGAR